MVIHDAFRPFEWANFLHEPEAGNVILDTHLYQCYTDEDRKCDIHAQVEIARPGAQAAARPDGAGARRSSASGPARWTRSRCVA